MLPSPRRLFALLALLGLFVTSLSHAGRDTVRVRADAAFHGVSWSPSGDSAEISGSLRDELGQPVGGAAVGIATGGVAGGGDAREGRGQALPCRAGDTLRTDGAAVVTTTDVLGLFCVRVPLGTAATGQKVRFAGDRYYGPAEATLPEPSGQRRLELTFDDRELDASLDESSFVVGVKTRLVDGVGTGSTVRLVLSHQADVAKPEETELSAADVQAGGRAHFDVETRALGLPGVGKLVVRFEGSGALSGASESALLKRTATARLAVAGAIAPADPQEGIEIPLGVSSAVGAVTDGWVIASFAGQPAGAAEVRGGAARLVATFLPQRGRPALLTLRYAPEQGGFVPGEALAFEVPLRGPGPWTWIPWMIVAVAIGYWVVRAWRRPLRAVRRDERPSRPPASGQASIDLVEADAANAGWHGEVLDAHEGTPIGAARISIVVPAFDGEGVAASYTTQSDGRFSLPHVDAARQQGAHLVVTAPFHTTLSGPAPHDGLITIALVSRRRTLLDRLVSWSRRAGRPWSHPSRGSGEPTPFEVAELARRRRQGDVATWAAAVGEAAFGIAPPDERREAELKKGEPPVPGSRDER
jgi:hypothetical protein